MEAKLTLIERRKFHFTVHETVKSRFHYLVLLIFAFQEFALMETERDQLSKNEGGAKDFLFVSYGSNSF